MGPVGFLFDSGRNADDFETVNLASDLASAAELRELGTKGLPR